MIQDGQILNYVNGAWKRSRASEFLDVRNPATAETMVRVPLSTSLEVERR
jgi:malonate-semialdehyde dehydrogenase (acetylating)/methylmalonate-semialdehyde dehydrogenase